MRSQRSLAMVAGLLLAVAGNATAWWGGGWNPYDPWDPRYWMEEFFGGGGWGGYGGPWGGYGNPYYGGGYYGGPWGGYGYPYGGYYGGPWGGYGRPYYGAYGVRPWYGPVTTAPKAKKAQPADSGKTGK